MPAGGGPSSPGHGCRDHDAYPDTTRTLGTPSAAHLQKTRQSAVAKRASHLPSRYLKLLPGDGDGDGLPAIAGGKVELEVTGRFSILVSSIWKGEIDARMLSIDALNHTLWKL